jgi:hypothetical protein
MIDEAQHLGKIPSGRRLLDQLDVVKSIANQTKTVHVLFGTYDLLAFRNLNGQLSRRSMNVHLARHRAEDPEDRQTFVNIVRSFEKELPFEDRPDLVSDWEFLYARSLGCVGVLKEWLLRAVTVASRSGGHRLTKANLEAQALSIAQCEQMHAETAHGELQLSETSEAVVRLRARMGLSAAAIAKSDPKQPASSVNFRRPGQRLPTRDVVGQIGANAAPFESWSLSSPPLPPRSQLYSLQPIGVGTGMVESLTGYVARFAEAHSVSVGALVGRVLSDLANPKGTIVTPAAKAVRVGGHGFRACSYAINGVSDRAGKWVDALEAATTRRDLRCLTLLPFRYALPDHLFRRRRAWCAVCFEQWRANGQMVYEPLLWAIEVSSCCSAHARPLDHTCPHCTRTLNPLGVFSRPGYCERCDGWLGMPDVDSNRARSGPPSGEDEMWACTQVGGLLAMLPRIDPVPAGDLFRRSLIVYLEQVAGGNVLALSQHIRCPHSILQNWLDGATLPRLENLLRTCRFLNIPASTLFGPSGPTPGNLAVAKEAFALRGNRGVSPSRSASELRQAIRAAFEEVVPRSVSDVARSLGYTNTDRLYQADRKLCHDIAARFRQSGRSHWWRKPGAIRICEAARLKEILEQSLKSNRPTSVHQVSASLG